MSTRALPLALAWGAIFISGCQQAGAPPSTRSTATAAALRSTATPVSTPTPAPALTIEKVGAAASPSGFIAFAVVDNPSRESALDVRVEIASVDSAGQALARRSGTIRMVGPGQRSAVALAFPVGRSLPANFTGSISGARWSADASPEIAQVDQASFLQDARTPSVRVRIVNHGHGADRVVLTAVCWDAAGNIRGGGVRTVMVGPQTAGSEVTIQVAIATVPTRCDAFGVSTT